MKKFFIIFFLLILSGFFLPVFAEEELTLTITPPLIKANISPGDVWSSSIKVVNNNPRDLEIFPSVMDFTSGTDGGVVFIKEGDTKGGEKFLLSHWVEIDTEPILIPAYQSKQVPFTIRVPFDAEPGGKYAAILAGTRQAQEDFFGAGIKISTLVSSLILANIRGDIIEDARIREFSTDKSFYQEPEVNFSLRLENIGNIHIQPQGEIRIFNLWGRERGLIPINHQTEYGNILPESIRRWNFSWRAEDSILEAGRYKAVLTLIYGNEAKQTLSRTVYFWVLPLMPTALILGGIILFFGFIVFTIRIYVRKAVFLAQKEAGITVKSKKTRLSSKVLKKPIFEAITEFRKKKIKTESRVEFFGFLIRRYFLPALFLLIFFLAMASVFFYFKDVLKEAKRFEVAVEVDEFWMPEPDQAIEEEIFIEEEEISTEEEDFVEEEDFIEEETVEIIEEESLKVLVLNGSGITGAALTVGERLKEQGFTITNMANADSFDYEKTLIKYKTGKEKDAELLNNFFNGSAELLEDENQNEDLIVIIGKDFEL